MPDPLVSYIVPYRNCCSEGRCAQWFEQCLMSLVSQTWANLEIILVDDGSTDNSRDIADWYAARDARIRLSGTDEAHFGLVWALNDGLRLATGEFIARLDADDYSVAQRTAMQVDYLADRPDVDIVGGAMQVINQHGAMDIVLRPSWLDHPSIFAALKTACPFFHPTVMMRASAYKKVGGYPEGYDHAEDYAYWSLVLRQCRGANMADVLTFHRMHAQRVSTLHAAEQRKTAERIAAENARQGGA